MKICIIGTGYVGLVTGLCFAEMGNDVYCIDSNPDKIRRLNDLELPIYEPGLEELLQNNLDEGRIVFSTNYADGVKNCEVCFIAVGTPQGVDGRADISYVIEAAKGIGTYLDHPVIVVNKSTVPVGTAEIVRDTINEYLEERGVEVSFHVLSNPEFLREGSAIQDCLRPDRIIIGSDDPSAVEVMKTLYLPFIRNTENFIVMDTRSAEMTKYVANAMLATKISFMNEMGNICEKVGANINFVRRGIGSDQRIGYQFIYAGCGYGGSCFPKDIRALISLGNDQGYTPSLLQAVENINTQQKRKLVKMVANRFGEDLTGIQLAIWGLSFKPDTDDMREAVSVVVIEELTKRGAKIHAFDPKAMHEAKMNYLRNNSNIQYAANKYEALNDADALILITEWKEFRSPDFHEMYRFLRKPILFDGRNQYDPKQLREMGFEYYQIGVGN